jgi:hypothetical protein
MFSGAARFLRLQNTFALAQASAEVIAKHLDTANAKNCDAWHRFLFLDKFCNRRHHYGKPGSVGADSARESK